MAAEPSTATTMAFANAVNNQVVNPQLAANNNTPQKSNNVVAFNNGVKNMKTAKGPQRAIGMQKEAPKTVSQQFNGITTGEASKHLTSKSFNQTAYAKQPAKSKGRPSTMVAAEKPKSELKPSPRCGMALIAKSILKA